jgi:hypothetical protein
VCMFVCVVSVWVTGTLQHIKERGDGTVSKRAPPFCAHHRCDEHVSSIWVLL